MFFDKFFAARRLIALLGGLLAAGALQAAELEYQLIRGSGAAAVPSGTEVNYLINYSCRPATGAAGEACENVTFTIDLDAKAQAWVGAGGPVLSNLPAGATTGYDASSGRLHITVPSLLASGQSDSIVVKLKVPNLTTPDGTLWNLTVGASVPPGSTTDLKAPTTPTLATTATAKVDYRFSKATVPSNLAVVGDVITYRISAYCGNAATGALYMEPNGYAIIDTLPAGFEYVSASQPPDVNESVTVNGETRTRLTWSSFRPQDCMAPQSGSNVASFIDLKVKIPANYPAASNGVTIKNEAVSNYTPLGAPQPADPKEAAANVLVYTGQPTIPGNGWFSKTGYGLSPSTGSFTQSGHWLLPVNPKPTASGHAEAYYQLHLTGVASDFLAELLDPVPCLDDAQKDIVPPASTDPTGQSELRYSSKVLPTKDTDPFDPANLCQTPAFHPTVLTFPLSGYSDIVALFNGGWRPEAVLTDGTRVPLLLTAHDTSYAWFKIPDVYVGRVALLYLPRDPKLTSFLLRVFGYADEALEAQFALSGLEAIRVHNKPSLRYEWRGVPATSPHKTIDGSNAYFRIQPHRLTLGAYKDPMTESPSGTTHNITLQLNGFVQSVVDVTTPVVITDLLPAGMSMPPSGPYQSKLSLLNLKDRANDQTPLNNFPFEVIPDYNGSGRTLLRWTLPALRPDTGQPMFPAGNWRALIQGVKAIRDNPEEGNTFVNTVRVFPADGSEISSLCASVDNNAARQSTQSSTDAYNEGGLGTGATHCLHTTSLALPGAKPASYKIEKSVQGNIDAGPVAHGKLLHSGSEAGTATYTLRLINSGSTDKLRNLVLYDVLPTETNEYGSNSTTGRGSEFTTVFTGMKALPAGATVQYSGSTNPCRTEVFPKNSPPPQPPGCVDDWQSTLDPNLVRAVRVTLPGPFGLGEVVEIQFGVKVKEGTTVGATTKTAFNDVAARLSMPAPNGDTLTAVDQKNITLKMYGLDAVDDGTADAPFQSMQEGTAVSASVTANDSITAPSGYSPDYSVNSAPAHGTLTMNSDGSFTYTPNSGFTGNDSFVYKLCYAGTTVCDTATVYLSVTANPPALTVAASNDSFSLQSNPDADQQTPSVFGNDVLDGTSPDATTVNVTLTSGGTLPGATIDADGKIKVPAGTLAGTYTVPYQICRKDALAVCADAVATITVTAAPPGPGPGLTISATDDLAPTPFSSTVGGELPLLANDKVGSGPAQGAATLTILGGLPAGVTVANGALQIGTDTPVGTYRVEYQICRTDAPTVCDKAVATFEVQKGPRAEDDRVTALPGQPMYVPVLGNDPDQGDLQAGSLKLEPGASGGVLSSDGKSLSFAGIGVWKVDDDTGLLVFEPAPGFSGAPPVIRYSYLNTAGLRSNPATVTPVLSTPGGDAPTAIDDTMTALPGTPVHVPVLSNDPEGQTAAPGSLVMLPTVGATSPDGGKTLVFVGQGTWAVDDALGELVFTPVGGFKGNPPVVRYIYVNDKGVISNAAQVIVSVGTGPQALDDSFPAIPGHSVSNLDVLGNDPDAKQAAPGSVQLLPSAGGTLSSDGKTLTIPGVGVWKVNADDTLSFVPEPGYTGLPPAVKYTYRSATTGLVSNPATVKFGGAVPQTPPQAIDDIISAVPGQAVSNLDVLGNDPDGKQAAPGSVQLLPDAGGTLSSDGKTLTIPGVGVWKVNADDTLSFVPEPGYTGLPPAVKYTYRSATTGLVSNPATVKFGGAVPQTPPQAIDDIISAVPGQAVSNLDVLGNDPDGKQAAPGSVQLLPDAGGTLSSDGKTLTIPGVGVWKVNADDTLSFVPEPGYTGLPPAVKYTYRSATTGLVSNPATVKFGGGSTVVVPIPTLDHLGLLLLAGLLGGLGLRQRQRRHSL